MRLKNRNGRNTRIWFDNWSPFGNMRRFLNLLPASTLRIRQSATIFDLYNNGNSALPSPWSDSQLALHTHLTTISLSVVEDSYSWIPQGTELTTFSTGMIYKLIKDHQSQVTWCKIIWTQKGIPKHNFLSWLMMLNRCPTKDIILSWGLQTDPICILCNSSAETRYHLLFDRPYSFAVWNTLAQKAGCTTIRQWQKCHNLHAVSDSAETHETPCSPRLASIDLLFWSERNARIYWQQFCHPNSLTSSATTLIKNKISSFRDSSPRLSSAMLQFWHRD